jgi:hypothetical protein
MSDRTLNLFIAIQIVVTTGLIAAVAYAAIKHFNRSKNRGKQ